MIQPLQQNLGPRFSGERARCWGEWALLPLPLEAERGLCRERERERERTDYEPSYALQAKGGGGVQLCLLLPGIFFQGARPQKR